MASPSVSGSVARMTSWITGLSSGATPSRSGRTPPMRCSKVEMARSLGPTLAKGSSAPPSTWYRPVYSPVRSMTWMSFASSTTQIRPASRPLSAHTRQISSRETLLQIRQKATPSRTAARAARNLSMSSGSVFRRWNAMRCALLGPTPGRRENSSIRSWSGPSNMVPPRRKTGP